MSRLSWNKLNEFYASQQEDLDAAWTEYLFTNDWGSGEDAITITEEHFWEWIESAHDSGQWDTEEFDDDIA